MPVSAGQGAWAWAVRSKGWLRFNYCLLTGTDRHNRTAFSG